MNWQDEFDNVKKWLKEYADEARVKKLIVGLSGGIDSAVVASLCCKAIGKENVIGISIPCQSSADSEIDAKKLANNLGIKFHIKSIETAFEIIRSSLVDNEGKIDNLTQENIKSRLRMVILYGFSNKLNCLVVGTSNKSELEIGFFTKGGDGLVDVEPLGNYYKTEVYKMAELISEIPDNIKTKAPSADLSPNQTDEKDIGMSYAILDNILINLGTDVEKLLDREKVDKVKAMIKRAEHKNNRPPRYMRE